jgi:hypothetical protein
VEQVARVAVDRQTQQWRPSNNMQWMEILERLIVAVVVVVEAVLNFVSLSASAGGTGGSGIVIIKYTI